MMKYRGPKDQHTIIERKYWVRLGVGVIIVFTGVLVTAYTSAASQTTVQAPNPADPGAGPIEVASPIGKTPVVGILGLIVGIVVNLWAISKYRNEYAEIKEKESRPEGMFIMIGLVVTLVVVAIGAYLIFYI